MFLADLVMVERGGWGWSEPGSMEVLMRARKELAVDVRLVVEDEARGSSVDDVACE